ncbi:MAG: hypothetical protein K2H40_08420 [Lachnospiraceae bacterium]|nr:hypothetical protein [Lachnospiraceae bacterium]
MMKKKITSRIITIVIAMYMAFMMTACGKSEAGNNAGSKTIEGDLQEVMAQIYAGVDLDAETKEAMQGYVIDTLTSDNEQALLGVEGVPYTEGIFSVPMMSSIAYQCVLLRVAPEDVEDVKTMLKENADVNKWVCVSAETVLVENVGDVVLFIMSSQDAAYAVSASFQALAQ